MFEDPVLLAAVITGATIGILSIRLPASGRAAAALGLTPLIGVPLAQAFC